MPISPSTDQPLPRRLREASLHHIALVGMPGVGKSTVAQKLGEALNLPVLDLDEEIASAARQSITQLFFERGEVLFRAQERAVLRELLHNGTPSVIACGGGTWADATMRRDLSLLSVPICLSAPVEVLLERLSDFAARKARPLLGGPDPMAALRKLERERRAAYLQCPTQLDTQGLTPSQVAEAALSLLEQEAPPPYTEPKAPAPQLAAPSPSVDVESVIEREADGREQALDDEVEHKLTADAQADAHAASATAVPAAPAPAGEPTTAPLAAAASESESDVAADIGLPDAPQIPWWPQDGAERAQDDAEAAPRASLNEDAMAVDDELDEEAQALSAPVPAPLPEENTPTLTEVARSLEPFSRETSVKSAASHSATPSEGDIEESWQPQMSAWAPLEDSLDAEASRGEPALASSASPAEPPAQAPAAPVAATPSDAPTGPLLIAAQGRSYPVHIAREAGDALALVVAEHAPHGKLAIICDTQINALFIEPLRARLFELGLTVSVHTFVAGEEAKTLKTVYGLYDELSDAKLGRGDLIVGFGGGVTLDVAGFVASTYLRGVRLMMVPTSTLAAVDACVGGKNGVNTRRGKNLVGTIYPPHAVYIAMEYLATQSRRAHTAGLVEVLKMGALLDPELFGQVASGDLLKLSQPAAQTAMLKVLTRALTLKAQVVEEDEHERGRRAILNYGHTVGHALEVEGGNGLSHGEAVGLGMVAEAAWAEAQGLGDGVEAQLRQALEAMNMPVDWRRAKLSVDALGHDKKRRGAHVQLPVLRALGDVELHEIPLETLCHYTQPPAPEA